MGKLNGKAALIGGADDHHPMTEIATTRRPCRAGAPEHGARPGEASDHGLTLGAATYRTEGVCRGVWLSSPIWSRSDTIVSSGKRPRHNGWG